METQLTKSQLELKYLLGVELESEMAWLRSIDMNNENDVRAKALELIMSRSNSIRIKTIKEIFEGKF